MTQTPPDPVPERTNGIGTRTEKSLHAQLKAYYAAPGDQFEAQIDGSIVDILRQDSCIEIQTRNVASIKGKLAKLASARQVLLVLPIPVEKTIIRLTHAGKVQSRRRSPRRGVPLDVFDELVYIPHLLGHPNFTLDIALIREETLWLDDGRGSWRRKGWSIADRLLIEILGTIRLSRLADYLALLPSIPLDAFTNRDLGRLAGCRPRLAEKISYTLLRAGVFLDAGKKGRSKLFRVAEPYAPAVVQAA